jgi:hypothetical protein
MDDPTKRAPVLGLILVGAAVPWLWESRSRDEAVSSLIPKNRTHRGVIVHDQRYSPPNADVRRKFDGEWRGRVADTAVVVLLLDGVGDCTLTSGGHEADWGEIEITEYFGDDLFDFGVLSRGDGAMLWTASYDNDVDEIRVWRVLPETERVGESPFVLRRIRAANRE